jgi:diguanylate cyclase (GGDEF)-like protein/PAS domain S-box-containing protein
MKENLDVLKNFTVLCVEDEDDVREELAMFLQRRVKTLYLAANGKEGLALFNEHRPDIVVTDILMPVLNGLEMAKEIKYLCPSTPVIITTAFNEADFFLRAIEIGIDKYVLKPVNARKFLGSLEEMAWLLKAKRELQLSATVFNASTEGIVVTDPDNKIIAINPAFLRITGYGSEDVIGKNPSILSSGRQDKNFYLAMWEALKTRHQWQGEIWNRRKSGEIYPEWLNINVVTDIEGAVIFHVAVFSDITVRKEAEQKLYHLAHYDPLTKLPNRTLLQDRLQQAIALAARHKNALLALLFIDLDRFKFVNDVYGHMVGDLLLQEVADRLKTTVRSSDTVSRIGGDEFVVLLPEIESIDAAAVVAQHIINTLVKPFFLHNREVTIGASVGISLYPDNGEDVESLMKTADAAMYTVKESGRNNFRFFQYEMNARLVEKVALEKALQKALQHEQFEIFYQPLFDLESHKIVAVEALLRWHHPDGLMRLPKDFLPLAEETGLIFPIGHWVMATALSEIKRLQSLQSRHLKLAVNISAKQLGAKDFAEQLSNLLLEQQFDPGCLELEISENVLLNANDSDLEVLKKLHGLGISIVISDFGFGYASLLHLNYLPINRLKIDRSFVINSMSDDDNFLAIAAITAMAKSLSLKVSIGELETKRQVDLITQQQSDLLVQGQHFCPPVPFLELQAQLETQETAGHVGF